MMQSGRSCTVREITLDREYRVAPPERWDTETRPHSRKPPQSRRARRRRSSLLPFAVLGLAIFLCGFFLGHALAYDTPPMEQNDLNFTDDEQEPVRTFDMIGAAQFGKNSGNSGENNGQNALNSQQDPVQTLDVIGAVRVGKDSGDSGKNDSWMLRLVNGENPLPENFAAPELTQLKNGHAIDKRAYPDLQAMMDAARAEGFQPLICSSFRSWDKQSELFQKKVQSYLAEGSSQARAEEQAAYWVARPGTSEHQMGLAVDIVDTEYQLLDRAQEERPVQKWLMNHCAEYGFILRYPTEKSNITGVGYEPWHYRYVGKDAAQAIMSAGLCLEEYLNP